MLQRIEGYIYVYALQSKERDVGGLKKFIGDRLRRWNKAKWGNLWDRIKSEMMDMCFFYRDGYRIL